MSTFTEEGTFECEITEAMLAESKFSPDDPEAMDVALLVKAEEGSGYWTGELSRKYGKGNVADKMQWELTLASLERIGWEHGTNINDETLQSLVGQSTKCTIAASESNGKTYYNVRYLGEGGFGPKKLDKADQKARLGAIFGHDDCESPKEGKKAASSSDDNPFK